MCRQPKSRGSTWKLGSIVVGLSNERRYHLESVGSTRVETVRCTRLQNLTTVARPAQRIAEKLDFVLAFGWRSDSSLRLQACFRCRLQPLRANCGAQAESFSKLQSLRGLRLLLTIAKSPPGSTTRRVAEKLNFVLAFGWRSDSSLRLQACFQAGFSR